MSSEKHLVLATIDESERPVSIRVLGAYAESLGIRVTLLVIIKPLATFGRPVTFTAREISQLEAFLKREKVTHLGFYLMTAGLRPYADLVEALRDGGYEGVVMAGGVHPTLCPEQSLVAGADFAVQGPGELPLKMLLDDELAAKSDKSSVPGLVWRDEGTGKTRVNPQTPEQKLPLDEAPFPLFRFGRDLMLVDGKLRKLTWSLHRQHATWGGKYYDLVSSRGCVYRCAYCCNVNGAPVRRSGVDRVIAELAAIRKNEPRIGGVNFQDDCFYAGSDAWLAEFCARMRDEVGLPFIARMIPRYVTPQRIELLKSGGLEYVTMGLEASDRLNRDVFNRKETSASFVNAAQTILASGLHLSVDVLINNPYEKEADLREVARSLNALPRPNWNVVALSLTPFPNTPLYDRAVRDGSLKHFATDAYDSMLGPTRPGGYMTPQFWLTLNTKLLPHVPPEVGSALITAGPKDPRVVALVARMTAQMERAERITTWLKKKTPTFYSLATHTVKLASRVRGLVRRDPIPSVGADESEPSSVADETPTEDTAKRAEAASPQPSAAQRPGSAKRKRKKRRK